MTTIKIGGETVDTDDPCALYQALYAVKLKRLAGEAVEESEIRSPATLRRIRTASVPIAELDRELALLAQACDLKTSARRRHARTFNFI